MAVCPEKQDRTSKISDDPCLRTYKKSRKRSLFAAPLIRVSSVVDNTAEGTSTSQTLQNPTPVAESEEGPASCTSGGDRALHTESVVASWDERDGSQGRKANEICPWEDE
jgi:hypothetical protein